MEAFYVQQYWKYLTTELTPAENGTVIKTFTGVLSTLSSGTADNGTGSVAEMTAEKATATTAVETATAELAALDAAVSAADALVQDLVSRIERIDTEIAELGTLATDAQDGPLDKDLAKRTAVYTAYNTDVFTPAETEKNNAATAVAAVTTKASTDDDGNAITVTDRDNTPDTNLNLKLEIAKEELDAAVLAANNAADAVNSAVTADGSGSLQSLRDAVDAKTALWNTAEGDLNVLRTAVTNAATALKDADEALDAAMTQCELAAYDTYRKALVSDMQDRADDLATIKALLEGQTKPALGAAGSRCEKALSNGTFRPRMAQGREMPCDEDLCCGAARVWETAGTTPNAMWKTIETCQPLSAEQDGF